jgi:hypothetical protein
VSSSEFLVEPLHIASNNCLREEKCTSKNLPLKVTSKKLLFKVTSQGIVGSTLNSITERKYPRTITKRFLTPQNPFVAQMEPDPFS